MKTAGQWECDWWRSPNFQHQAGLSRVPFGPLGRSPGSGTDNQGARLKWERSGRGHPPLFPWPLATQFLNMANRLATPLRLSLNRFIPTQTKSTNILAAQAMPTGAGQGDPGWDGGLGPCSPDPVFREDTQKSILYLGALGSHRPFPAQLTNILKHKPVGSACLGCTPGFSVCVSPKLELALRAGNL